MLISELIEDINNKLDLRDNDLQTLVDSVINCYNTEVILDNQELKNEAAVLKDTYNEQIVAFFNESGLSKVLNGSIPLSAI